MSKRTLICEGSTDIIRGFKDTFNNFILVSNTSDLVYDIFYTDTAVDTIIIGNDFEVDFNFSKMSDISGIDELLEIVGKYNLTVNSKFFAIELGKFCKELSSRKSKTEPKIVIFSPYDIEEDVKKNNMVFLPKNGDFFEKISSYLE